MDPLIFLCQRIPLPPQKGDKIRSFAVLRHLARTRNLHVGCFIDDPADWDHVEALRHYCTDVCCIPLDKTIGKLRSLTGLVRGKSLSEPYFHDLRLAQWVDSVLKTHHPRAAFVYSSVMAQYIPRQGPMRPERVVMDFVDVDSDKWRQYAEAQAWPMNQIYRRESKKLFAFDRDVCAWTDASVFVSPAEATLFRTMVPEHADKIHAISNGIDLGHFTPSTDFPSPFEAATHPIVFTGSMDYWPNIDAVRWFANEIFPTVATTVPSARFVIVGANPTREVLDLAKQPGITVTGRVADVRPYLSHAAVAVAPMRVARGIQNKVLEAMAMGRVVVTTSQGWEGINAKPGQDLLVEDSAADLARATLRALTDPEMAAMGAAARACMVGAYGWDDKLAAYERLLTA
ncbi:TIGR03087 family PEP-CTERM/XrtA system glycosyltransferase [Magnetospirillum molischianum]|uniref:Glycosyl transferase, group 1 n=1 Tax=Magnetospirillum molischianum DSM 120 TaxID=1150626 RepID=H8FQA9_MAGML|nr:TIGR03087 family PEP-CTERM/XrtA system glycosyltransferase [Magnetospirillum molischianum]CCG40547.1 Glycosyl transferase, group 1 [Magnetospirillum molischianum DSM 120]